MFIGYMLKKKRLTAQAAAASAAALSSTEMAGVSADRPPYEPITRSAPFAP
jgi:hypothetical protein